MNQRLVRCINADKCTKDCPHKEPHEPKSNGGFNYSYHNCRDERTLMCGKTEDGYVLDGNCQPINDDVNNVEYTPPEEKIETY